MKETKLGTLKISDKELNGLTLGEFLRQNFGEPSSDNFDNGDDAEDIYVIEREKKNG